MVTISDLQKLPVQLALFGLIIQFEHLVVNRTGIAGGIFV